MGRVVALTDKDLELFRAKNFAHVSTLREDGAPHSTVVWVDAEDGRISFNSAGHSAKIKHLRHDPRLAVSVHSEEDPYLAVTVLGTAVLTTEGAEEHLDALTRKYTEYDRFPDEWRTPGEERVKVEVTPRAVLRYGY